MAWGLVGREVTEGEMRPLEVPANDLAELPDDSGDIPHKAELLDDSGDIPYSVNDSGLPVSDTPSIKESECVRVGGGSYKSVRKFVEENGHKNKEVHHIPSDWSSPLERNDGPCIEMDRDDHRRTASCGKSIEAQEYREKQKELIAQGKFREALQMDIDDIYEKFGNKYDDQIQEMLEYVNKLEQEGKI